MWPWEWFRSTKNELAAAPQYKPPPIAEFAVVMHDGALETVEAQFGGIELWGAPVLVFRVDARVVFAAPLTVVRSFRLVGKKADPA